MNYIFFGFYRLIHVHQAACHILLRHISPSGIFIIMPSAFALLASEQLAVFAFAKAGTAPIVIIATAVAQANMYIMFRSSK